MYFFVKRQVKNTQEKREFIAENEEVL